MTKISNVSTSTRIENGARRFIADLGLSDALLPVILLEISVDTGRGYNAYKRGGFVEARERVTEDVTTAVFWLGGVHTLNKLGDVIGKKFLGIENPDFEVGKDMARNPFKNYLGKFGKHSERTLAMFKCAKIASSILIANAIIGFAVPKINQAITRKYQKSLEELDKEVKNRQTEKKSTDKFVQQSSGDTTFKGNYVQTILSLSDKFENDAKYKLLSTDAGISGGRAINARNKNERNEILFRDLSSIYFYLWCRGNLNSVLNMLEDGKWSRLNTVSAKQLDEHMQGSFTQDSSFTPEEFENLVFGDKKAKIPEQIQAKIKDGVIGLEDLRNCVDAETFKIAQAMSKLQPELAGRAILTEAQLQDVYAKGLINHPEFLARVFETHTDGKSINPLRFVPDKNLRKLKQEMVDYVELIISNAKKKGEKITIQSLKRANKLNFIKSGINLAAGFAVSALFLSTIIPKVQYLMTLKRTGENKFPGVQKYDK